MIEYFLNWFLTQHQDTLTYAAHPINAYHLMKRTTMLWPELFENTSDDLYSVVEDAVERFPIAYDFNYGATFGVLSVQVCSMKITQSCDNHSKRRLMLSIT